MADAPKTTLPVIKEEIAGHLRRDYPQQSEDCVKFAIDEVMPWIEKCNPLAAKQINGYAIACVERALEEITQESGVLIPKDLAEIIKKSIRIETVTSAALLYKILDVQGQADEFRKLIG